MSEYIIESQTLTDIADAIRGKTGSSSLLTPLQMPNAITSIPSGGSSLFTLIGQSTHVLLEYTDTTTAETIDTNIDVTSDDHAFLLVTITCDGTPAVEGAWGGLYVGLATRYMSTRRVLAPSQGVGEYGTRSLLLSEASNLGTMNTSGPIHIVSNVPTVKFIRKALSNGRTVMGGTYTVKVYGLTAL